MAVETSGYDVYAEAYDEHSLGVPGDVEFYRRLALEAAGPVIELGVGTGRIAIPIAQAGARVTGIDLSRQMLRIAARKAAEQGVRDRLALAQGDMRRFAVVRPVSLVTIPYRSFLHNLTTEDQLATLAAAREALVSGGRLALNVFNPDITMIAEAMRRGPDGWSESPGRPGGMRQRVSYEPTAQIVRNSFLIRRGRARGLRFSFTLRYLYRFEMEHLLIRAGFEIEELYGDHAGSPFVETSTEMVWVARRA